MKKIRMLLVLLAAAVVLPVARAQEKAPQTPSESATAYRVQVVLSEFDGTNKLSSMPYTIPIAQMAGEPRTQGSLRVGIRVPVNSSAKGAENSFQYVDIGMNLEVRVKRADAERYAVEVTFDRSWLYVRQETKDGKIESRTWGPGDPAPSLTPLNYQFRGNVEFLLRDGRASETALATDPVTGHVMKVDVVLTVLK